MKLKLPHQTLLNSGYRFYELEVEHTEGFLGVSQHFITVLGFALLVPIVGLYGVTTRKTHPI
jgi:hypothetical protein